MAQETLHFKVPLKGELLKKTVQRYPDLEASAIEAITMLQAVSIGVKAQVNCSLDDYGLSEGKFYVLCFLFKEDLMENATPGPSDIAEHLGVTRATITGLLDGLERDDYLERRHDSGDRRALTIHITPKGRQCLDAFMPMAVRNSNRVMAALDEEERQTLIRLLGKIEVHLEKMNV